MVAFHSCNTQNVRSCFVRTWFSTRSQLFSCNYSTVPGGAISATASEMKRPPYGGSSRKTVKSSGGGGRTSDRGRRSGAEIPKTERFCSIFKRAGNSVVVALKAGLDPPPRNVFGSASYSRAASRSSLTFPSPLLRCRVHFRSVPSLFVCVRERAGLGLHDCRYGDGCEVRALTKDAEG